MKRCSIIFGRSHTAFFGSFVSCLSDISTASSIVQIPTRRIGDHVGPARGHHSHHAQCLSRIESSLYAVEPVSVRPASIAAQVMLLGEPNAALGPGYLSYPKGLIDSLSIFALFLQAPSNMPVSLNCFMISGSTYLLTVTSSARPFLLLVLRTKSLAVACAEAGSRGRSLMLLSSGSPGTMLHRSNTSERVAAP